MALSNTYDTTNPGSAVSNREDLANWVSRVVPEKTPVYSLAPKQKATATFHEWTVDKLKSPSTMADGINEGADVSTFSDQFDGQARLGNYVQVFRDTFKVSRLQQSASNASDVDYANAKAKAMINVKLGVEYALCSDNDRQAETGTGTPYKLRGLGDWIDTAGPSDVPSDYRATAVDTNGASITEDQFQSLVETLFTASGEVANKTLVAATGVRSQISSFTRSEGTTTARTYNVNEDATSKKLTYSVSMFDTDYGLISIMNANPDCMPDTDRAYLLDQSYYYVADFYSMGAEDLEDQGGGPRGFVDCALTLCVKNPRALGEIN